MYSNKELIQQRVQEHYIETEKQGLEVLGVFLQGSQNYQLDYEESDIDTKAIIVPSMRDIILNRSGVSTTHILDNNEHIDLKDIRLMFNTIKKQNVNFVEILFSKYFVINEKYRDAFQPLLDIKEEVARYNLASALNCMSGMAMEKYKALEHPYPSIIHKIEKYGMDSKQLHHIIRMREFIERYTKGERFEDCLIPNNKEYLINVKKHGDYHSLEEAREISSKLVVEIKDIKDRYLQENSTMVNKNVENVMENVLYEVLKIKFKEDLEI